MCSIARFISTFVVAVILSVPGNVAAAAPTDLRGGRVSWARLLTPDRQWNFHGEQEPELAKFIAKETGLNLEPSTYKADPENLDQLCTYPLIFTPNIFYVRGEKAQRNLVEYLHRGGFIWVDFCYNLGGNGVPPGRFDSFFAQTADWFAKLFPQSELRKLPPSHDIFRCYFEIDLGRLWENQNRPPWGNVTGMYGVFDQGRMIALVSLSTIMCGWATGNGRITDQKRMAANILVYAMTRPEGGVAPDSSR